MHDQETAEVRAADAASGSGDLVRARGLTKRFDDFVAVDGVDFSIARGEAFGSWVPTVRARRRPCA
ncbi:hypothetical protein BH20ACT23_BH20ACT23_08820 [soil metagenome]